MKYNRDGMPNVIRIHEMVQQEDKAEKHTFSIGIPQKFAIDETNKHKTYSLIRFVEKTEKRYYDEFILKVPIEP